MADNPNKNACLMLGTGCGCLALLLVLVVAGAVFWGVQAAKQMGREMEDPEARTTRALDILGADELPPGYHAVIGLEIPWIMRFALLTDGEPPTPSEPEVDVTVVLGEDGTVVIGEDGATVEAPPEPPPAPTLPAEAPPAPARADGEHSFLFFEFLPGARLGLDGEKQRRLEDFFSGASDDLSPLREADIQVDLDEVLRRGELRTAGTDVRYVVGRGDVDEIDRHGGLHALFLLDCGGDPNLRLAIWSGPESETIEASDAPELAGTVGDEAEMQTLLDYFAPCP